MDTQNNINTAPEAVSENFAAGIIGAIICGLLGVVLYVVLSMLGFIAGISGFVAYIAAYFGYKKLAGVDSSVTGIVVSVIVTLVMLLIGEYISLGWYIYDAYKSADAAVTFGQAFKEIPDYLAYEDVQGGVIKDLAVGVFLTVIAIASQVKTSFRAARNKK